MSEHSSADPNSNSDTTSQVFELQENPPAPARKSALAGMLRYGLYGMALVILGGLVALQVKPELSEYVAAAPGVTNLLGQMDAPHECPLSKQSASCQNSCSTACPSQATGSCCSHAEAAIAVRPPAPPTPEMLDSVAL